MLPLGMDGGGVRDVCSVFPTRRTFFFFRHAPLFVDYRRMFFLQTSSDRHSALELVADKRCSFMLPAHMDDWAFSSLCRNGMLPWKGERCSRVQHDSTLKRWRWSRVDLDLTKYYISVFPSLERCAPWPFVLRSFWRRFFSGMRK